MLTLQTHDTKRSADVRARLAAAHLASPRSSSRSPRRVCDEDPPPDADEGWFFLQTVVAAPIAADRLGAYVEKALRERKRSSSWVEPDETHEQAAIAWIGRAARTRRRARVRRPPGRRRRAASCSAQTLLQLTSPGVPDVYQGDEDGSLALVDPDNRRPVDWAALRASRSPEPAHARGAGRAPRGSAAL